MKMSKKYANAKTPPAMRDGPVHPGSSLYRLLELLAQEVAKGLSAAHESDSNYTKEIAPRRSTHGKP
jgi:hypothetical protein